jgi:hypothetical protein
MQINKKTDSMKAMGKLFAALLAISSLGAQAQSPKVANTWYFGAFAGIDFSGGRPIALSNGAMAANEGSVSVSNRNGDMLFYSNGGNLPSNGAIWNRNHQVMLNGDLATSKGCGSSFQSSLALLQPGQNNRYYMFATDCRENNLLNGLSYHVIDMNLDGGLGGVVQKDISLLDYTTESLIAAKHANGKDYWIIVSKAQTDTLYAFQLTRNGIEGVVKSKTGVTYSQDAGEIKVSANGERLVFAGGSGGAHLYKFNNATGVISEPKNLNLTYGYAAAFSPDCQLLYVTEFSQKKIFQYAVTARNVGATKTEVGSSSSFFGSLQNGPDGRIYVARRNAPFLGVIEDPNVRGTACTYTNNGVSLGVNNSRFGLPNYPNDIMGECVSYPEENVSRYNYALHPRFININSITLTWNPFDGGGLYRIGATNTKTGVYTQYESRTNQIEIANLDADTEYEFRLEEIIYENAIYQPIDGHSFNFDGESSEVLASTKARTLTEFNYNVYPNPAKNKTTVEINTGENPSAVSITLLDASGKVVYQNNYDNVIGYQSFEISLQGLPTGIYNLTLTSDNTTGNKRLVVLN